MTIADDHEGSCGPDKCLFSVKRSESSTRMALLAGSMELSSLAEEVL
jgi:hypothetical protein